MEEDLIEAFDNFVVGNFQQSLEICSLHGHESGSVWESLAARCHLALHHMEKVREYSKASPSAFPALAGTAFFAVLQKSHVDTQRKAAFDKIVQNANDSHNDPVACYYACVARTVGGDFIDAINYARAVGASSPSEFNALCTQLCLSINRPDLAVKNLSDAAANKDDSAAMKLVAALLALTTGKPSEACMCYSDLIAQFNAEGSLALANGRAIGNLMRSHVNEAKDDLETALSTKADDPDTVRNMVCCLTWEGKRAEAMEYMQRLRELAPHHSLIVQCEKLDAAFQTFASSVTSN